MSKTEKPGKHSNKRNAKWQHELSSMSLDKEGTPIVLDLGPALHIEKRWRKQYEEEKAERKRQREKKQKEGKR